MGLSQALFSAISGLTNHQRAMDNIGNNLANVNTVAFKKGVFQFRTLLEQTLRGGTAADPDAGRGVMNPLSVGLGTQTGSINKDYRQGSMEVTGNSRDMAIEGNGFFLLRSGNNNVLTRDGTFYIGSDGSLLGNDGMHVQGVQAINGEIPEAANVDDLLIPIGQTGAATETTRASFTGNLNSDQEVAAGTRLIANGGAIADPDVATYIGDVENTDNTWVSLALAPNQFVNGGTIQTTAALAIDPGGAPPYAAANITTDLSDLYYLSGNTWVRPFNGISDGDTITMSFRKGGRLQTAEFTYSTDPLQPSRTLDHFMNFLAGDVDDTADVSNVAAVESVANTRLQGGIMGTIKTAGRVATSIPGGTSPYNAPIETAGGFTRTYTNAVDYGTGILANSFNLSILSNLGSENAITDIEITYNNVKYTDIFAADIDYGQIQGGSSTTNVILYDSLGNSKNSTIQMSLVERDTNFSTWRWIADSQDDTDADWQLTGTDISTNLNVGTGLVRFDSEGMFVRGVELSESGGLEITLEDQGVNNPLAVRLREGLTTDQDQDLDFSAMTQVAAESDFNLEEQDGSPPGTLDSFTVTGDGIIQGVYSNGVVENLGRLSVALVPNQNGLVSVGSNLFYEGPSSGAAQVGFAGVGGRGQVRGGQLETSNVDLSEEFTRLITTERGFQANARVITTSDEMLVELVNLKR